MGGEVAVCLPPRVAAGGIGEAVEVRLRRLERPVHVLEGEVQEEGRGREGGGLRRQRHNAHTRVKARSPRSLETMRAMRAVQAAHRVVYDLHGAACEEVGGVGAVGGEASLGAVCQVIRAIGPVGNLVMVTGGGL